MVEEEDEELEYFVKVDTTKISIQPRALIGLAIECYCTEIKSGKKYTIFHFDNQEYAQAFTNFVNRLAKPSGSL